MIGNGGRLCQGVIHDGGIETLSDEWLQVATLPDCDETIAPEDINIKEGVALCPQCGKLSRLSQLNVSGLSIAEILANRLRDVLSIPMASESRLPRRYDPSQVFWERRVLLCFGTAFFRFFC